MKYVRDDVKTQAELLHLLDSEVMEFITQKMWLWLQCSKISSLSIDQTSKILKQSEKVAVIGRGGVALTVPQELTDTVSPSVLSSGPLASASR